MYEEMGEFGSFGLINPQTVSTLVGMFTFSFDRVKFSRQTAIAAPPPLLLVRGVLIYCIPSNSSSSSILNLWDLLLLFLFRFFFVSSHISEMQQISIDLSLISVIRELIFGNKDRALKVAIVGIEDAKVPVLFLILIRTDGNL